MKQLTFKKLNTKGFAHHLLIALLVISIMAGFGAWRVFSSSAATTSATMRIMPLGDSITYGMRPAEDIGGYRLQLYEKMILRDRRDVTFVGSLRDGSSGIGDGYKRHEGHPGWRIDQIRANIDTYLSSSDPDVVLLHIGTNDIMQDYRLATAPDRLQGLVNRICQRQPSARLIVATIAPIPSRPGKVNAYNRAMPDIVRNARANGCKANLVDMNAALADADISTDGVHPSQTGYNKMGDRWYVMMRDHLNLF